MSPESGQDKVYHSWSISPVSSIFGASESDLRPTGVNGNPSPLLAHRPTSFVDPDSDDSGNWLSPCSLSFAVTLGAQVSLEQAQGIIGLSPVIAPNARKVDDRDFFRANHGASGNLYAVLHRQPIETQGEPSERVLFDALLRKGDTAAAILLDRTLSISGSIFTKNLIENRF